MESSSLKMSVVTLKKLEQIKMDTPKRIYLHTIAFLITFQALDLKLY